MAKTELARRITYYKVKEVGLWQKYVIYLDLNLSIMVGLSKTLSEGMIKIFLNK